MSFDYSPGSVSAGFFLALSLSACGGGSDSANDDKTDSPSAEVDSGSTNSDDDSDSANDEESSENNDEGSDPTNGEDGSDSENNGDEQGSVDNGGASGPTDGNVGDSDSGNSGDNDGSADSGDSSGSTNDSNVPHVSVATPASGTKITQVIGGQYELSVDGSGVSEPFSAPEHPTLMMALNENDDLAWLGMADQTNESLTLGPESTAFSLVLLYPMISVAYSLSPEETRDAIVATPEFAALRDVLASTDDWAYMVDPIVQDAYASALIAAATAIETAMTDGGLTALQQQSNTAQLSTSNKKVSLYQNPTFEALVSVPENPTATRSGVRVDISGTYQPATSPDTELNVTNLQRRWVGVLISKNKDGSSPVDFFSMAPASSITFWKDSYTTISRSYPLSFIEDPEPLYVSVLGPSLDGFPDGLSSTQKNRAIEAAVQTTASELMLPVMSSMVGGRNCVKELLTPVIFSPLTFYAEQPQFRSYLLAQKYGRAAVEAVYIILDGSSSSTTQCLLQKAGVAVAKRMIPIVGQIKTFVDAIPAMIQVNDAMWVASNSKWHEQWVFNNETLAEIDVTSEPALRSLLAGYGVGGYVTKDKIPDGKLSDFPGTCIVGQENAQCLGFTFDNDPPWSVDFAVRCRHPETNDPVACREASFGPTTEQADSDGVVRGTIDYVTARESSLAVEAVDTYGARRQQTLGIQIKQAQPQLEFVTGNLSAFSVDNGVLTVDEPLEFECCDAGQESVTKTVILSNDAGNSEARIISIPTSDTPGFDTTIPSTLTIPAGESVSFDITYDPRVTGEAEQTANVTLFGHLGGGSPSTLYKAEEYSTMVLPVKGKNIRPSIEVIGANGILSNDSIIDLGTVKGREESRRSFTIRNVGHSLLIIEAITSNNGLFRIEYLPSDVDEIPVGAEATFDVVLKQPLSSNHIVIGSQSAEIRILSNDETFKFGVSGQMVEPDPPVLAAKTYCSGNTGLAKTQYRVESDVAGKLTIRVRSYTARSHNWGADANQRYDGNTVMCGIYSTHYHNHNHGLIVTATDEFSQAVTYEADSINCSGHTELQSFDCSEL